MRQRLRSRPRRCGQRSAGGTFTEEGDNLFIGNDCRIPAADGGLTARRFAWDGTYRHTWAAWTAYGQDAGGTVVVIP